MSTATQTLKAVATGERKDMTPIAQANRMLDKLKPQMALALPKHMNPDRMARLALTQFSQNPKLLECTPVSVAGSIVTASQMGLEIGVNGQGYLVPYGKTCQFIPGWQGLIDLLSRAGRAAAWTGAVHKGDEFDYALGDRPFVRHRPGDEDDPSEITHVYAVGRVNGSEYPIIEVWTVSKVRKHRDKYNKVGTKHYSFRDWEMYARKIPLLQVLKYLPKSVELQRAVEVSNATDIGAFATIDGDFVAVTDPDTGEITGGNDGGDDGQMSAGGQPPRGHDDAPF